MVVEFSDSIGPVPFAVAVAFLPHGAVALEEGGGSGAGNFGVLGERCVWKREREEGESYFLK